MHILKYIFPRQFGLHNVFTFKTDYRDTSQPFKDYTLREQEITRDRLRKMSKKGQSGLGCCTIKDVIPKRLRGHAIDLVRRLRVLHHRCSYVELLRYYCPIPSLKDDPTAYGVGFQSQQLPVDLRTEEIDNYDGLHPVKNVHGAQLSSIPSRLEKSCFTDLATPDHQVSAFCRAIMNTVIPNSLWGEGETQTHNKHAFLCHVDQFVRLRRFESLTLHAVMQYMKV